MVNSIKVNNLTKIYSSSFTRKNNITALDNLTLEVEKGIVFGLLGPNGAGKTTLIKVLLGIVFPTSGTAEILDKNVSDYEVRKKIGYLPENHKFPNYLTGEEVIIQNAKLSGYNVEKNSSELTNVLELVNMTKWRKTKVKKYSKGMMQRIGLAQAIIHNPEIIFLDEPTDGVDPIGRKEIRDILADLKSKGKTIFINSHLLSEVELISDKVAILNNGKLVKHGTIDELTVDKEIYEIKTELPLEPNFENSLKSEFTFKASGTTISLEVNNNSDVNKFMDKLRDSNYNILSINQKKNSLEDMFIKSLTENNN